MKHGRWSVTACPALKFYAARNNFSLEAVAVHHATPSNGEIVKLPVHYVDDHENLLCRARRRSGAHSCSWSAHRWPAPRALQISRETASRRKGPATSSPSPTRSAPTSSPAFRSIRAGCSSPASRRAVRWSGISPAAGAPPTLPPTPRYPARSGNPYPRALAPPARSTCATSTAVPTRPSRSPAARACP